MNIGKAERRKWKHSVLFCNFLGSQIILQDKTKVSKKGITFDTPMSGYPLRKKSVFQLR